MAKDAETVWEVVLDQPTAERKTWSNQLAMFTAVAINMINRQKLYAFLSAACALGFAAAVVAQDLQSRRFAELLGIQAVTVKASSHQAANRCAYHFICTVRNGEGKWLIKS